MNRDELERLLRQAAVPERSAGYWADFPKQVTRRLARSRSETIHPQARPVPAWVWGIGLAAACIVAGFIIGFQQGRNAEISVQQLAAVEKYYREVAGMFPNQLQAIVLEESGPRLVLAPEANVAAGSPIYLNVCGAGSCKGVLTFSGQAVKVNGEAWEVLLDSGGNVLVVGPNWVWSSVRGAYGSAHYRIQAKPLESL